MRLRVLFTDVFLCFTRGVGAYSLALYFTVLPENIVEHVIGHAGSLAFAPALHDYRVGALAPSCRVGTELSRWH